MPRKLSERAAWVMLAEAWKRPKVIGGTPFIELRGCMWAGLCGCIGVLWCDDMITAATEEAMYSRIRKLPFWDGGYRWPLTLDGARSRAAFCRAQADAMKLKRKLKRKRKPKRKAAK